jgi:menaquinone-dependent protoporphyrinogen oxidase
VSQTAKTARATGTGAVLVAYATRYGSTEKVAQAVGGALAEAGLEVDVRAITPALDPTGFVAAVIGAPMIRGWHRDAQRFVKQNRTVLAGMPTAYFITCMSLTDTGVDEVKNVPVFTDPWLAKKPRDAAHLRRRERYASPEHYLGDVLDAVPQVRPRTAAFFGGAMDLTAMRFFDRLFVLLAVGATPGDSRNWKAITEWASWLPARLA